MSNDLLFQRAKKIAADKFPYEWDKLEVEAVGFPCEALAEILVEMGASPDSGGRYELDFGEDGRLYVDLHDDSAFVDMHVSPKIILQIFEALVARDPMVVLFEMGQGQFHSPKSYKDFVRKNYEEGA